jgi:hypothetical protein
VRQFDADKPSRLQISSVPKPNQSCRTKTCVARVGSRDAQRAIA